MDTDRWQRIGEIFEAVAGLEGEARERALDARCGGDEDLRREVESLLAADTDAEAWLAGLTARAGIPAPEAEAALNAPGRVIGAWRLVRQIGRGGMGVVYLAERADDQFRMQAALKALPVGLITRDAVQRFQRERDILASLDHPHIARLLDGGVTPEGTPYYVMEYVAGLPLNRYCEEHAPSLEARIRLFEQIASAVAYAHRHLVIHRDIKPANVLVTGAGEPKLLDFGVAKLIDAEAEATRTATQLAQRRVTPAYTAPELLRGEPVTTACDVYSLGIVLYELLSGTPPFAPGFFEQPGWTDRLAEYRPPPPSRATERPGLRQRLKGDLDTIVAMAMHPDPARRYPTVNALISDLQRHEKRLPVAARPDSLGYRASRFVRRHALGASLSVLAAMSLIGGAAVATWQAHKARQAFTVAQVEAERTRTALAETEQALSRAEALHEFLLDLFRSVRPNRPRDELPNTRELLEAGAEQALDEESAPPAERVSMLVTIGEIYRSQYRREKATELFDAAVALAREHRDRRPADLANALLHKAWVVRDLGEVDRAQRLLEEAETVVQGSEEHWDTFLKVRAQRAWNESIKGNHAKAVELTEPLYVRLLATEQVDERARVGIINTLAVGHGRLANFARAAQLWTDLIGLAERWRGTESHTYAVFLANSVSTEYSLGRFETAESRARQALDLYDRIYEPEQPTGYRGAARRELAYTLLYAGRYEEALDELEAANTEWARSLGKRAEEWPFRHYHHGVFLAHMHRWRDAEGILQKARDQFLADEPDDEADLIGTYALLAWTQCHQDKTGEGAAALAEVDERLPAPDALQPFLQSRIHQARACCHFQAGRLPPALEQVDAALTLESDYPGHVLEQANLRILRARILSAQGRQTQAIDELDRAREQFTELGLADHPALKRIEEAREYLLS